jgi:putative Holliday junction resolvase
MRLLGLDVGQKTIGLAVSDDGGVVASPLRTLSRVGGKRDLEAVAETVRETGVAALVLGLPLELSGREGQSARRVRRFGEALGAHLGCAVHYWDERFSTAEAERALLEGNLRRAHRRQVINHIAAALILQSYLDAQPRAAGVAEEVLS